MTLCIAYTLVPWTEGKVDFITWKILEAIHHLGLQKSERENKVGVLRWTQVLQMQIFFLPTTCGLQHAAWKFLWH